MSNPRTVTRFIEQRVTLGQIAHEAYRARRNDAGSPWAELSDEQRAGWEAAAAAVADAVEGTRADEPPVQRIEKKSLTIDELNDLIKSAPKDTRFYLVPNTPSDDLRQPTDGAAWIDDSLPRPPKVDLSVPSFSLTDPIAHTPTVSASPSNGSAVTHTQGDSPTSAPEVPRPRPVKPAPPPRPITD